MEESIEDIETTGSNKDVRIGLTQLTLGKYRDFKPIIIQVTCPYRASCYQNYIENIILRLRTEYGHHYFVKRAIETPSLWQYIADQLDLVVMHYLNKELQTYYKIDPAKAPKHTPEARRKLIQFLKEKTELEKSLRNYLYKCSYDLNSNQIRLEKILLDIAGNFEIALTKALDNVINDKDRIHHLFFSHLSSNNTVLQLAAIHPSGSDLHKKGQQVLILEFLYKRKVLFFSKPVKAGHVVYKPSSGLVDMRIIGNTKELQNNSELVHEKFKTLEIQSAAEKINSEITGNVKIPTYKIYPSELFHSEHMNNIIDAYCYLEYLPHEPWSTPDIKRELFQAYENELSKIISTNTPVAVYDLAQKIIIKHEEDRLQKAIDRATKSRSPSSDYVLIKDSEYENYSRQCGMTAALLYVFGVSDMHVENMIGSSLMSLPIDLEVALQMLNSLKETGAIYSGHGAWRASSNIIKEFYYLYDFHGIQMTYLRFHEKNIMYKLKKAKGKYIAKPCEPNPTLFLEGFAKTIAKFTEQKDWVVNSWFVHTLTQNIVVRKLPRSTGEWQMTLNSLLYEQFDKNLFYDNVKIKLKNKNINIFDYLNPQQARAYAADFSESTYSNLTTLNIPFFYQHATRKDVSDSEGNVVVIPYEKVAELLGHQIKNNIIYATTHKGETATCNLPIDNTAYHQQTPLEAAMAHFNRIIANPDQIIYTIAQDLKDVDFSETQNLTETAQTLASNMFLNQKLEELPANENSSPKLQ